MVTLMNGLFLSLFSCSWKNGNRKSDEIFLFNGKLTVNTNRFMIRLPIPTSDKNSDSNILKI